MGSLGRVAETRLKKKEDRTEMRKSQGEEKGEKRKKRATQSHYVRNAPLNANTRASRRRLPVRESRRISMSRDNIVIDKQRWSDGLLIVSDIEHTTEFCRVSRRLDEGRDDSRTRVTTVDAPKYDEIAVSILTTFCILVSHVQRTMIV